MGDQKIALETIKESILSSQLPLQETATHLVFGKGNSEAQLLFIGEAPGGEEDKQGIPFVGRAGKELDTLLGSIGLSLDDVYIANILKYRPPNNRDPTIEEIKAHTPFLIEQIKAIQPKVIATLGNFSTKFVLAKFQVEGMKSISGISQLHGKAQELSVDGFSFTAIPLYHPAAMLYNPNLRETQAEDFKTIQKVLGIQYTKKEVQQTL